MKKRVTQQDIAAQAGVHRGTVSLALRNNPRIPAQTRQMIQEVAERLGYSPDPMLSSLAAYRTRQRSAAYHGVLAWLVNTADGYRWEQHIHYRDYHAGAKARAWEHGFALEVFDINQPEMTSSRLAEILAARGIQGILLCPQSAPASVVEFQWERFSAVTFGYSVAKPRLNTVAAAHYISVQRCLRELYCRGYRRIGLATSDKIDQRMNQHYISAYLGEQYRMAPGVNLPPFVADLSINRRAFQEWYAEHRPDAIVTHHYDAVPLLKKAGLNVPRDIGVACPNLPHPGLDLAGVVEDSCHIGGVAVDVIVGMIQRGERGRPDLPQRIHIEGRWSEGKTLGRA